MTAQSTNLIKVHYTAVYHELGCPILQYATPGSAGFDLRAIIREVLTLQPMQRAMVPTGIHVEIPQGTELQIRPRSGLAYQKGITLVNCVGTIDSDFRGEVNLLVINLSPYVQHIIPGDRIAQAILSPYLRASFRSSNLSELSSSDRDIGGFGSTGTN